MSQLTKYLRILCKFWLFSKLVKLRASFLDLNQDGSCCCRSKANQYGSDLVKLCLVDVISYCVYWVITISLHV